MNRAVFVPFWTLFLVLVTACAALGVSSPQTFNESAAFLTTGATAARQSAQTLLVAGKISPDDAQHVQDGADQVVAGVKVARAVRTSRGEAAGEAKLAQVRASLVALQAYLATKDKP